jgi:SAM-dependent methyltransferase
MKSFSVKVNPLRHSSTVTNFLIDLLRRLRRVALSGNNYFCPLCRGSFRSFLRAGEVSRQKAKCPGCGSLERHRLLWLALARLWDSGEIGLGGALLHIAPEESLTTRLKSSFEYLSADLDGSKAMVAMDITAIPFPENSFDAIVCNHVLEHVPQDRRALSELYRVMKPGGWGSIQVPMAGEDTKEDEIPDIAQRILLYGQSDHVRSYGLDFMERLKEAGFTVLYISKSELLDSTEEERISVAVEQEVVLVRKPFLTPNADTQPEEGP